MVGVLEPVVGHDHLTDHAHTIRPTGGEASEMTQLLPQPVLTTAVLSPELPPQPTAEA
ncbi:hypothetical protein [Streptomyces tauricus]|uniref:hypothetical protein n=1 Tax=Streptomyces tauricus TaxID=68274 RepID=UPI00381B1BED